MAVNYLSEDFVEVLLDEVGFVGSLVGCGFLSGEENRDAGAESKNRDAKNDAIEEGGTTGEGSDKSG